MSKIHLFQNPLDNSRPLDVHRWSSYPQVIQAVNQLTTEFGFTDTRYKTCLRMLLMDLYHCWRMDPTQFVAYNRGRDAYAGGRRYNRLFIKYRVLINSIRAMITAGYIENHPGTYFYSVFTNEYQGKISRMRATPMLLRLIVRHRINRKMIGREPDEEVIKLRGLSFEEIDGKETKVKFPLEYDDEPDYITNSRVSIKAYNALLARTYIDIDDEYLTVEELVKLRGYSLDLSRKFVHRVFNNGAWDQGGRYYGSWWLECPKLLRKHITINGNPTVELDYTGIHIHLLYAIEKINYAATGEDPYELEGFPIREANKFIMLIAVNAENEEDCIKGVWKRIVDKRKTQEYGIQNHQQIRDILHALKAKHSKIADHIASGYGVRLQFIDSCIAEQIVNFFTQRNIPILTVHDSFICSQLDEQTLLDQMRIAYTKIINQFIKLKCRSTLEVIRYDCNTAYDDASGDIIIEIERKSLPMPNFKARTANLRSYSQGRRQLRWQQTGSPCQFTKLTNIAYIRS